MNLQVSKPEYFYQTEESGHHHDYLLKPLMEMISASAKRVEGGKARILDIGCGNGSLSNFIAQQGIKIAPISYALYISHQPLFSNANYLDERINPIIRKVIYFFLLILFG
jgi:SAM-dependent methyltransferase